MKRIGIITSVFLLMTITFLPSIVIAVAIAGTETINEGEYWHTEIPLLDRSEIYITISVLNGIPIDIFLFDEENFELYRNNESYEFILEGSRLNTIIADIIVTLEAGTYFLVVDNTDAGVASPPLDNVNNIASITYNINYPALQDMLCFFVGVIAVIVVVILLIVLIVKKVGQTKQYQQPYPQQHIYQQPTQPILQMGPCHSCGKQIPIDSVVCPYCDVEQEKIS